MFAFTFHDSLTNQGKISVFKYVRWQGNEKLLKDLVIATALLMLKRHLTILQDNFEATKRELKLQL